MRVFNRLRGIVGIATVQLYRNPTRTALAVVGISLAVLATTLLMSVGIGVIDTGQQKFSDSGRDLWVTGGAVRISPDSATPLENSVIDAHTVSAEISRHDDVAVATPMAFQGVYVGRQPDNLKLVTGVGVPRAPADKAVSVQQGSGLEQNDVHYANGTYDGPMTRNVLIDPRIASLFNATVGDSLYIGGSRESARSNEFRVVGISSGFSRFLGTPSVTLHLSELQEITGTTGADRATFISVRLQPDASPQKVKADLEQSVPGYEIRTNREQFQRVLEQNAVVIASGSALVVLAIIAGLALTSNLLTMIVQQQRVELAALEAIGMSRGTLAGIVGTQGILLGIIGGSVGLLLTPLTASLVNTFTSRLIGFDGLIQVTGTVYVVGASIAVVVGTVSAIVSGRKLTQTVDITEISR